MYMFQRPWEGRGGVREATRLGDEIGGGDNVDTSYVRKRTPRNGAGFCRGVELSCWELECNLLSRWQFEGRYSLI